MALFHRGCQFHNKPFQSCLLVHVNLHLLPPFGTVALPLLEIIIICYQGDNNQWWTCIGLRTVVCEWCVFNWLFFFFDKYNKTKSLVAAQKHVVAEFCVAGRSITDSRRKAPVTESDPADLEVTPSVVSDNVSLSGSVTPHWRACGTTYLCVVTWRSLF